MAQIALPNQRRTGDGSILHQLYNFRLHQHQSLHTKKLSQRHLLRTRFTDSMWRRKTRHHLCDQGKLQFQVFTGLTDGGAYHTIVMLERQSRSSTKTIHHVTNIWANFANIILLFAILLLVLSSAIRRRVGSPVSNIQRRFRTMFKRLHNLHHRRIQPGGSYHEYEHLMGSTSYLYTRWERRFRISVT